MPTSATSPSTSIGRVLFALATFGLGLQYALYGHLSASLPPLPYWLHPNHNLAYAAAAFLIAASLAVLADWQIRATSLLLGLFLLVSALLHLARVHAVIFYGNSRSAFFEPLALAAGALVLHARAAPSAGKVTLLPARVLFALAMIVFGIQQFLYPGVAALIPRWISYHHLWVVFTGVAMIAAGFAILARVLDNVAAFCLFLMFLGWLLLLQIPLVAAHPRAGTLWTSAFVVLGLCGASLILTTSAKASPAPASTRSRQRA